MKKRNVKKSYDRILEISEDSKQITLPDSRYYRRNGEYYPSITYVLSYYPKGKFFEDWLKKVGYPLIVTGKLKIYLKAQHTIH